MTYEKMLHLLVLAKEQNVTVKTVSEFQKFSKEHL